MQIKRGKVKFGYKDTFSLDDTLSEIIHSGLVKFKEVINSKDGYKGAPVSISGELVEQEVITYLDDHDLSEEDWDACEAYFNKILDKMIYAFEDNEPDILDYDMNFNFKRNPSQDGFGISGTFECTNEQENKRYDADMIAHNERCEQGRTLFAKHFKSLWW